MLIDSHTHVHFRAFKVDMNAVVERSLENGVQMITVGTQSKTSRDAVELAEKYDGVWAAIGLHPNHLHKQEFEDTNELIKTRAEEFLEDDYIDLVKHPKVVAIGEFGLDMYHKPPGVDERNVLEDQIKSNKRQLKFANKYKKPVIIHCRDAHKEQFSILNEAVVNGELEQKGVIHSFTGTIEDAKKYISIGFRLGLNGILTFSKDLQQIVKEIPLENILLETDAPYLTPPPFRGKRNEPSYVQYIAEFLAEMKQVSLDEVSEVTTYNTKKLFKI